MPVDGLLDRFVGVVGVALDVCVHQRQVAARGMASCVHHRLIDVEGAGVAADVRCEHGRDGVVQHLQGDDRLHQPACQRGVIDQFLGGRGVERFERGHVDGQSEDVLGHLTNQFVLQWRRIAVDVHAPERRPDEELGGLGRERFAFPDEQRVVH